VVPGHAGFTLTITGQGFLSSSTVQLNGQNLSTAFASSTSLSVAISATDVVSAGQLAVTVVNPAPGGGTSNQATLLVGTSAPASAVASLVVQDNTTADLFGTKVKNLGNITGVAGQCDSAVGIAATNAVYVVCNPESKTGKFTSDQIGTDNLPGFKMIYSGPGGSGSGIFFGLAAGGDIDHDGINEILVYVNCASTDPTNIPCPGAVFAVHGGSWLANLMASAMKNNTVPVVDLNDSTLPIVRMQGVAANNFAGQSMADGKDFDGDGFADIAFGAPGYNSGSGAVYLIYGYQGFFNQKSLDLTQVGILVKGAIITRSPSTPVTLAAGLGSASPGSDTVEFAGDLTGDHLPELLIGDPGAQNTSPNTQKVYAVFGTGSLIGTFYVEDIGTTFSGATYLSDHSGCGTTGDYCYTTTGFTVGGRDGSVMLGGPGDFIVLTTAAGNVFVSTQALTNGEILNIMTAAQNLQGTALWDYSTAIENMGFTVNDSSDFRLIGATGFNNGEGKLLFVPGSGIAGGNLDVATVTLFTATGDSQKDLFGFGLDRSSTGIMVGARSFTNDNPGKFYFIPKGNILF
jgi:FG-GAP repeat/IPT/TIG domain